MPTDRPGRRPIGAALALLLLLLLAPNPASGQAPADGEPAVCRIGMNVEDLYALDMAQDTFRADLWIWSICPSAELDPLETISFPTALPGLGMSLVQTTEFGSGSHYTSRRVQGAFRYNWDMDHYPFDRQRLVIPIDENRYGAERLLFEPDTDQSFLTPDVRDRLDEWRISDLALETSVSEEPSTYGMPDAEGARYARLEAAVTLERTQLLTFLKLTAGSTPASSSPSSRSSTTPTTGAPSAASSASWLASCSRSSSTCAPSTPPSATPATSRSSPTSTSRRSP
jgi:hypothetical protein